MRCEAVRERLPGYLDRDLRAVGALEEHLASCAGCRAELEGYRRLRRLLSELSTSPAPSQELLPLLMQQIPERSASGSRARYALASLGGAAVGATALAIVWWRVARRPASEPQPGAQEQARAAV